MNEVNEGAAKREAGIARAAHQHVLGLAPEARARRRLS